MALSKEILLKAVAQYKSKYNGFRFVAVEALKPKQLTAALKNICPNVKPSEVVAFWDETSFNSGKKGFLLTADTLYFSKEFSIQDNKTKRYVRIDDMVAAKKKMERDVYKYVGVVHENGQTEWIKAGIDQDDLWNFLRQVLKQKEKAQPAKAPVAEPAPKVEKPSDIVRLMAQRSQGIANAEREGRKPPERLTMEEIGQLIDSSQKPEIIKPPRAKPEPPKPAPKPAPKPEPPKPAPKPEPKPEPQKSESSSRDAYWEAEKKKIHELLEELREAERRKGEGTEKVPPKPVPKPAPKPAPKVEKLPGEEDFEKGVAATERGDKQTAFLMFRRAADAGISAAMYNLAMLYGQNEEYESTFDWMRKAAQKGCIPAYSYLSHFYEEGIGTESNLYAAQYWARMAVQNGDSGMKEKLAAIDSGWRDFLRKQSVGARFTFGTYPQAEDGTYEPIAWRVLDKQADKMLVISEYVLDRQHFCTFRVGEPEKETWAESELRRWLNHEFWNTAFREFDTTRILNTKVHTETNPDYALMSRSLPPDARKPKRSALICADTMDRLFVPSWDEVIRYLCDGEEPKLQSTGFQKGKRNSDLDWYNFESQGSIAWATKYTGGKIKDETDGLSMYKHYGISNYWLRNVGKKDSIMYVFSGADGGVELSRPFFAEVLGVAPSYFEFEDAKPGSICTTIRGMDCGVRPAMWLDLRELKI